MNNCLKTCKKFLKSRSGSYAVIGGLTMPLLASMAAAGLELSERNSLERDLQFLADSAAYAAINNANQTPPVAGAKSYIAKVLASDNWRSGHPMSIVTPLRESNVDYNGENSRIEITINAFKETPFLSLIGYDRLPVRVRAVAQGECQPFTARFMGNAYLNKQSEYVLTPDKYSQAGWVWLNNTFDMSQRQDIKLRLYFGTRDASGADGMTFTIHNDRQKSKARGQTGEALGVAWHPARQYHKNETTIIAPAIVVEFDTWQNKPFDPPQDHTAIFRLGEKPAGRSRWGIFRRQRYNWRNAYLDHRRPNAIGKPHKLPNIEDGRYHFARFIWDPAKRRLLYFFDGRKIRDVEMDVVGFLGSNRAYMGFSASTGGARNEQKACFFKTRILS